MNLLPKAIYRISILPIKLPMPSFTEPHGTQKSGTARARLRMKHGAGGIRLPDFRLYCKATVISEEYGIGTKTEI